MEKMPPAEETATSADSGSVRGWLEGVAITYTFPGSRLVLPPQGRAVETPSQFLTDPKSGLWRLHSLAYKEPCPADSREIIQHRLRLVARGGEGGGENTKHLP